MTMISDSSVRRTAELSHCGECYHYNWKTVLRKHPEPPECSIKHRLGWVFDTDPACEEFEPRRRTDETGAKRARQ